MPHLLAYPGMRIGLLGGSFNPAHDGHREISLEALARLKLHQVWWVMSPQNPQKSARNLASYEARVAEAEAVAAHPRILVSDFEQRHGLTFTKDTLAAFKQRYPGVNFVWLMGADNLVGFHTWEGWREIALSTPIAVFARPGYELKAPLSKAAQVFASVRVDSGQASVLPLRPAPAWAYITETRHPLSSTQIRKARRRAT